MKDGPEAGEGQARGASHLPPRRISATKSRWTERDRHLLLLPPDTTTHCGSRSRGGGREGEEDLKVMRGHGRTRKVTRGSCKVHEVRQAGKGQVTAKIERNAVSE